MEKTEDFIINRLTWKASKYKIPSDYSFYFNDLTIEIKNYLYNQFDNDIAGTPVLFFTKPTKQWTLICTKQVICNDNKKIIKLNLSDIEHFHPTAFKDYKTQKIKFQEAQKSEWDKVDVTDKENRNYTFHAFKGADLFAMWNILLMAARLYD